MKKILSICILFAVLLIGCGEQMPKAKIPFSSEEVKGTEYTHVQKQLSEIGFKNIRVEYLLDLEKSDEVDIENTIQSISIDGNSDFKKNKKFELESEIIIKYHSYKESNLPLATADVKGMSHDEIKNIFDKSAFFNVHHELIPDEDKDNVNDDEIESITVNGAELDLNKRYSVADKIIVYHSLIEKTMPILSSEAKGKSYDEIKDILSQTQFEIESKLIRDTDFDNIYENEIEYIEIDSTSNYSIEDTFPIGTKVIVYHSYMEDKMPISSDDAKGMNYSEVQRLFEGTKFNNIKLNANEDVTNVDVTETTVDHITVNGSPYNTEDTYPYNSEIVINYSIKRYNVSIKIDCRKNLIFSQYNLDVYFDDTYKGTLEHGGTFSFNTSLKKGKYILKLKSEDDSEIVKDTTINVSKDSSFRHSATCNLSSISIANYPQVDIPYTSAKAEGQKLNDVVDAFKKAGCKNVKTQPLNDLGEKNINNSNTVKNIKIDGNDGFTKDGIYYSDSKVVIYYHSGKSISIPIAYYDADDLNYKEVVQKFKDAGFINVSAEEYTGDDYSGAKDGLTESVSIAGDTSFYKDDKASLDAPIIVYYYSINYQSVTVSKMMADMENNAYNAKSHYTDKYFAVTGYVDSIDADGWGMTIVASTSGWEFDTVKCNTLPGDGFEPTFEKLSKNKKVTVKGKITYISERGYEMSIHDIIIH